MSSSEIDTYLEELHAVDGNNDTSSEQQQPTFVNRESVLPESLQAMLENKLNLPLNQLHHLVKPLSLKKLLKEMNQLLMLKLLLNNRKKNRFLNQLLNKFLPQN